MIDLHMYWLMNLAIMFSYLIAIFIFKLPVFSRRILQKQKLILARSLLILSGLIFILMPILIQYLPFKHIDRFQLQPIFKNVTSSYLQKHEMIQTQISTLKTLPFVFSLDWAALIFIFIGMFGFFLKYILNLYSLYKITNQALYMRNFGNLKILFTENTPIPFCWTFLKFHFVIIPANLLQKSSSMKLAIQHELQHIRQKDTYWLHCVSLIKVICFWNPFIWFWMNWLSELQEFACDESLILRNKVSEMPYAECLVNTAKSALLPQGALAMTGPFASNILKRRVSMLFSYKDFKKKKISLILAYGLCFFAAGSAAFALNNNSSGDITAKQLSSMIKNSDLKVSVTPELVEEINHIRNSDQARKYMETGLKSMKQYQNYIQSELKKRKMPNDLLALPLVESDYLPLAESKNPMHAAGVWQFIPTTAKEYGLIINEKQDDRMNIQLSTRAALTFLNSNYEKFHDWKLAVFAYEYGDKQTAKLIEKTGSRDFWKLANASGSKAMKDFVLMFDAAVIIMNNPDIVNKS